MKPENGLTATDKRSVRDVRQMIDEAGSSVAAAVKIGLTQLYWCIGRSIIYEILKDSWAPYGKGNLATLSQELTEYFGAGFSYSRLTRRVKLFEFSQEEEMVATLL